MAFTADNLQANTWRLKSAGNAPFPEIDFLGWARIEVSAEEDTITLSGEIPGITAESELAFGAYDYLGGSEEVGCLSPFGFGRPAVQGLVFETKEISDRSDAEEDSHDLVGHIDIRGGFDYMLSAAYFVPRFFQGNNTVAEITQPGFVKAGLWGLHREGYRVLAEADIEVEVSAEDNTITLSGEIPGITAESPLKFRAYDYFAGSVWFNAK